MILEVAGMLALAGFLTWGIGAVFEYPEIAFIGGTIIIVVGAMVMLTGLEYRTGETVVENTSYDGAVIENSTVYNTSQTQRNVSFQYQSVPFPTQFPAGAIMVITGGVLAARVMGEAGGFM